MFSMDVHIGMFIEVLMMLMFILISAIFWSFYVWLLQDSQSVMYKSGAGLYIIVHIVLVNLDHNPLQVLRKHISAKY